MRVTLRTAALVALAGSALALGGALAAEAGGLVPCALCLWERWPYRAAIAFGVLAAALPRRWAQAALLAALIAAAGLGALHVGVERRWWPSPAPECAAPALGGGSIADRLARMPATPSKPCDEPAYLVPAIPVSMAALNLLAALALSAVVAISLVQQREPR